MQKLLTLLYLALSVISGINAYTSNYKVEKLNSLYKPDTFLELDSKTFNLFTEKGRNYSILVVLTAIDPQFGCEPCVKFKDEYAALTKSYSRSFKSGQLYFANLDFSNGRDVFMKMQLQNVPHVLFFPATEGPNAKAISGEYELYDFNNKGLKAEPLAQWLENVSKVKINFSRPVDYTLFIPTIISAVIFTATIIVARKTIIYFLTSKQLWCMLSLGWILIFCSGHMWNQIRGPPYQGRGDKGAPELISPSFSSQYLVETQILAALYGLCAFSFILLSVKVPQIEGEGLKRVATYVSLALFVGFYSLLLRMFNIKQGGAYPFKML